MCRNYHHHIVDIVDRLIGGVKAKGPHTAVNIADIAQVCSSSLLRYPALCLFFRLTASWILLLAA